jgi:hypothetical protein
MRANILFFFIVYTVFCIWKIFVGKFDVGALGPYIIGVVVFALDQFLVDYQNKQAEEFDKTTRVWYN